MRRRRRMHHVMLPGRYAVGPDDADESEAHVAELVSLLLPYVEAVIGPRVRADRNKFRCSEKEVAELSALIVAVKLAEGSTPRHAAAAGMRIAHDMRNPPDLTPEEEAEVVREFVNEETEILVRLWLDALTREHRGTAVASAIVGDDMLPSGCVLDERTCREFIYLEPADVRTVLAAAKSALDPGDTLPDAALLLLLEKNAPRGIA